MDLLTVSKAIETQFDQITVLHGIHVLECLFIAGGSHHKRLTAL